MYISVKSMSKYQKGISISIIGTFGFFANILSVHVLLRCRENRNFHRLLAGLAIVDTVLIVILVLEMSVVGVFMKKEPLWYIISYPYIIHPGRGIVQVSLHCKCLQGFTGLSRDFSAISAGKTP